MKGKGQSKAGLCGTMIHVVERGVSSITHT
jgi:hypothetical protein